MREGGDSLRASRALDGVFAALQAVEPKTPAATGFYDDSVRQLNDALDARRDRLEAARGGLPFELAALIIFSSIARAGAVPRGVAEPESTLWRRSDAPRVGGRTSPPARRPTRRPGCSRKRSALPDALGHRGFVATPARARRRSAPAPTPRTRRRGPAASAGTARGDADELGGCGHRGVREARGRRRAGVPRRDPDSEDPGARREPQRRLEHDGLAVDAARAPAARTAPRTPAWPTARTGRPPLAAGAARSRPRALEDRDPEHGRRRAAGRVPAADRRASRYGLFEIRSTAARRRARRPSGPVQRRSSRTAVGAERVRARVRASCAASRRGSPPAARSRRTRPRETLLTNTRSLPRCPGRHAARRRRRMRRANRRRRPDRPRGRAR